MITVDPITNGLIDETITSGDYTLSRIRLHSVGSPEIAYVYTSPLSLIGHRSYYILTFHDIQTNGQPTSYVVYSSLPVVQTFAESPDPTKLYGRISYERIQSNANFVGFNLVGMLPNNTPDASLMRNGDIACNYQTCLIQNEPSYLKRNSSFPNLLKVFTSIALSGEKLQIYLPKFLLYFYANYQFRSLDASKFLDDSIVYPLSAKTSKSSPSLYDLLKTLPED